MAWKRRRPTWPYLAVLCFLFALTLAAPQTWQRRRGEPLERAPLPWPPKPAAPAEPPAGDARTLGPALAGPAGEVPAEPALPPLAFGGPRIGPPTFADPELAEPRPAGPTVASDDYFAVDEPLVDPAPADDITPTVEPPALAESAPSMAIAPNFAPAADAASIPAPAWRAPRFSAASLVRARDAMIQWMREAQSASAAAPPVVAPRVVVSSENDRLAMAPPRPEPLPGLFDASPVEPTPELTPSPAPLPASDFQPGPMPAPFEVAQHEPLPAAGGAPTLAPEPAREPTLAPEAHAAPLAHRPDSLLAQLAAIDARCDAGAWAAAVEAQLGPLFAPAPAHADWQPALGELERLARQGYDAALRVADPAEQSAWVRAARALDRRLPVWRLLLDPRAADLVNRPAPSADDAALLARVRAASDLTSAGAEGANWRRYLRLDDLAGLTSVGGETRLDERRAAARDVLVRLADPQLTADQRRFLSAAPLVELRRELLPWASGPISLDALAAIIERYEAEPTLRHAAAIGELRLRMRWSGEPRLEALAEDLNRNYRNGNARVALSQDFFNRLIPPQKPVVAPVNDSVTGAEVRGRARTQTRVRLVLLPDPAVWRLGLEVQGAVTSNTYSDVGAARVRNHSTMQYDARKLIVVNRHGMHVWPAEAKVRGRNELVGVDSHLGPVPVLGQLVDGMIRESHRQNEPAAMAQAKAKVSAHARQRMDREVDAKLAELERKFTAFTAEPFAKLALAAEPLEMTTTAERAVMRIRLADEQHLGAHTPRPSAPSDSLVSVQIHESALNNAARTLGLDGRRITAGELHALLAEKLGRTGVAPPEDLPQRAVIEFAKHDAVRVHATADRVELVLNIVELRKGRDSIRGVAVHAFFKPVVDGLQVKLVRDGTMQFEGAHLRTGPRIVLHSVFGKLIRAEHEVPLMAESFANDPRFAGMMVTQLVIDDGWTALSLGPAHPERTAWRTRTTTTR